MKELVFVYGTLKEGRGNHYLLKGAKKVGNGVTVKPMFMHGTSIPFVTEHAAKGKKFPVVGEVYEVTDEHMMARLDALEGHPEFYERRQTPIVVGDRHEVCWLYFYDSDCAVYNDININPELGAYEF